MRAATKSAILTLTIPGLLAEVLSTNTPLVTFINPIILLFIIVAYGIPVLLMREAMVRWKLGLQGLFLLGLAYGLLNEGIFAKTLLRAAGIPIPAFDGYGFAAGFAWPWTILITFWHAFHGVIFPIMIIHVLVPESRDRSLMSTKMLWLAAIPLVLLGHLSFFTAQDNSRPGTPFQYVVLITLMFALLLAARSRHVDIPRPRNDGRANKRLLFYGSLSYLIYIPWIGLADNKGPILAFVLITLAIFAFTLRLLGRQWTVEQCALISIGSYAAAFLFGLTQLLGRDPVSAVLSAALFLVFSILVVRKTSRVT